MQRETFPSIDGILLLDDIIGFIGEAEFKEFGLPFFTDLYNQGMSIKFLHNDAACEVSVKYLPEMGVNLFNMGFDTDLNKLKAITGNTVTMLGNIPPRDVLAAAAAPEIQKAAVQLYNQLEDKARVIFSCGGGMPPGVSTANVRAFIEAVHGLGC